MITDRMHKWLDKEGFMWSSVGNSITIDINSLDRLLVQAEKNTPSNSDYEKCSHVIGLICGVLDITISECDELNLLEIYPKIVEIKNVVKELSQHFA